MRTGAGIRFRPFPLAVIGAAVALTGAVQAQPFPSKPIEFNVHTSPGGGTDVFARAVSDIMGREKIFSQPLIVANRPGGSGSIAFNYVKRKKGDPHVILTMATGSFLAAANRKELDVGLEHFTPLASFALDPQAVAVSAECGWEAPSSRNFSLGKAR